MCLLCGNYVSCLYSNQLHNTFATVDYDLLQQLQTRQQCNSIPIATKQYHCSNCLKLHDSYEICNICKLYLLEDL